MPYTNVSANLTEQDVLEIRDALNKINEKLPFLVHLTADERRRLFKMGDKSLAFVSHSINAAQTNPQVMPVDLDLAELMRDYQLSIALNDIRIGLRQLLEKVDDTWLAASSEAMSGSLIVYKYVKVAAERIPGLKAIADQLGARFKAIRSRAPKSPETPKSPEA